MDKQSLTIDDIRHIIALSDLPDEHLQWILDHSEYCEYADGDLIAKYGQPAEVMWFSIMGKVNFYMYINGHQVYYFTFENSPVTGGAGGLLPYSRMKTYPGYSYASGEVKLLRMHKTHFAELEKLNPDLIQRLIGYMTERARLFATTQLQHEKVNALGKLAAGIAHEMNNPAAAIREISDELSRRLNLNYELTKKLLNCNVRPEQIQHIHSVVESKNAEPDLGHKESTLKKLQKQDEMEDWLADNGISDRAIAETFAENGYSPGEMISIRDSLGSSTFVQVIPWLENLISSQKIIKDLSDASGRISNLVSSIKSYVHMDRTSDLQPTDVQKDIENTLTLLGFKLREKNIDVHKHFIPDLPEVNAYVGELNQVWTNLIDNAIFAMEKNGILTIKTSRDAKNVLVTLTDNGSGIPPEIISRIFDPFFTTKKVGDGNGIGLDIVSRIIKKHNGTIQVISKPGCTEFSICLPIVQPLSVTENERKTEHE